MKVMDNLDHNIRILLLFHSLFIYLDPLQRRYPSNSYSNMNYGYSGRQINSVSAFHKPEPVPPVAVPPVAVPPAPPVPAVPVPLPVSAPLPEAPLYHQQPTNMNPPLAYNNTQHSAQSSYIPQLPQTRYPQTYDPPYYNYQAPNGSTYYNYPATNNYATQHQSASFPIDPYAPSPVIQNGAPPQATNYTADNTYEWKF